MNEDGVFTITDLKQYIYCPRIFFYQVCLPDVRPVTVKMARGIDAHEQEQKRAARRTLAQYDEVSGTRHFDVPVFSAQRRLSGQIDEVVETSSGVFPVDYKLANKAAYHYKIQLTAYALLLEEETGQTIKQGYLYLMRTRKMIAVRFTAKLRQAVTDALVQMAQIATDEWMPPVKANPAPCVDCEFRRFCNDV